MQTSWKLYSNKTKFTLLLSFASLSFCQAIVSWADPKLKKTWNFDSEVAGIVPKNFIVGTLVDGRPAGKWKVIDIKTSMSLLEKLDQRDHTRVRKVLQNREAPTLHLPVISFRFNIGYILGERLADMVEKSKSK